MKLFLACILFPLLCFSQINETTIFHAFNTDKGLPSNSINCIIQDKEGYIWLGTENGLTKFDGYTFYTYRNKENDNNSLPHNRIFDLEIDINGTIWAATSYGFVKFNKDKNNFTVYNTQNYKMPNNDIQNIEIDLHQNIWFTTTEALCMLNQTTQKISVFPIRDKKSLVINKIKFDAKTNTILLSVNNELLSFNLKTLQYSKVESFKSIIDKEHSEIISCINFDCDNNIWLGTNYGRICKINKTTNVNTFVYNNAGIQSTGIQNIFVDSKGNVFFLIDKLGLSKYSKESNKIERIENNFFSLIDHRNMLCMFEDMQHNYWFGHQMYGLCYTQQSNNFTIINSETPSGKVFKSNLISALCVDANQTIWVGTDGGGVYFKKINMTAFKKMQIIPSDVIQSINTDNNGNIWFGTLQNGVFKYSITNESIQNIKKDNLNSNSLATNNIHKVIVDKSGVYWFATHGKGVTSYSPKTNQYRNYSAKNNLSGDWTYDIVCDKNNSIWIATSNGLSKISANRNDIQVFQHHVDNKNTIVSDHIFALYLDSKQNLWCATQQGVSKYSIEKQQFANLFSSLDISFNSIINDDFGFLWLGTSNGIIKINFDGTIVETFNSNDELGGSYYNINTCAKDKKGNLYFGGSHGITTFTPNSIKKNTLPPIVSISNVFINETSMFDDKLLDKFERINSNNLKISNLAYSENNIVFEFAAINFINTKENQYAYRLIGLDTNWQIGKLPYITKYNTLPSGDYIFEIKACNNSGIWSKTPLRVSFTINPPFWKTWIFAILVLLTIIGIVLLYIYYKTKSIREQNLKLEQKVTLRTHELSIALNDVEIEKAKVLEQNEELIQIADKLQEQNQELDKMNKTKNRLFSIIAHDIKNPFFSLLGLGKQLQNDNAKLSDDKRNIIIKNINLSADTIYSHLSNMLDWARGQSNAIKINPVDINLKTTTAEIIQLLQNIANNKDIVISTKMPEGIAIYADKDMFQAILRNFLNNAIKFTPKNGSITITASKDAEQVKISIIDTGIGISEEDIEKILNPNTVHTTYGTNNETGTGLGIVICQQFITSNNGALQVESEIGKGSRFIITLPIGNMPIEETSNAVIETETEVFIEEEIINLSTMKLKNIVVVEDNKIIQDHLKNELSKYFTITCADNGMIAWPIIEKNQPDIVLSDVAMPEMDGYTLCAKIKQTLQTSHIPVILVTAQRQDSDRFAGLESGANDYILKPYKISELILKIKNIFETTEQLKKRFKLEEKDYSGYTSVDDKFLMKFTKILEEKYTNPDVNVVDIGKEIGMSRANLYRKCIALTGKNPSDLLQEIRINNAIELLKNTDLSVSEIAYTVGYSDPRYFSTRFKTYTGKTPSEIRGVKE